MIPSVIVNNLHSTWNNIANFYKKYYDSNNSTTVATMEIDEFCSTKDMAMTMFMDGFHFTLYGSSTGTIDWTITGSNTTSTTTSMNMNSVSCLYYFVNTWKLDDSSKFKGAMVFTIILAILVEALAYVRGCILRYYATTPNTTIRTHRIRRLLLVLCYTMQGLLGYSLMLITMSFSVELVASVIFGLMIGHVLFMNYSENMNDSNNQIRHNQSSVMTRRRTRDINLQISHVEDEDNLVQRQQQQQSYYYPQSTYASTPLTMHQTNQSIQSFTDNQRTSFDDEADNDNDVFVISPKRSGNVANKIQYDENDTIDTKYKQQLEAVEHTQGGTSADRTISIGNNNISYQISLSPAPTVSSTGLAPAAAVLSAQSLRRRT